MRRAVGAFVVVAALAASCSASGEPERPDATLSTPSSTTTEPAEDPYAIPDDPADIDEAYVQRVVDALYEVEAQAARLFIDGGALDQRGVEMLSTIYDARTLEDELQGWTDLLADPARLEAVRATEGRTSTRVDLVRSGRSACVFAEATRDYSKAVQPPPPPRTVYIGLTRRDAATPADSNPTPWILFQDGPQVDPAIPVEDPCDE